VPNSILAGAPPQPRWGSLQRSPDPLAGLRGPTSKGRGGDGKGRGWGRNRGDVKGRGSLGEGRGRDPTPSRPQSIFLDTPLQ